MKIFMGIIGVILIIGAILLSLFESTCIYIKTTSYNYNGSFIYYLVVCYLLGLS